MSEGIIRANGSARGRIFAYWRQRDVPVSVRFCRVSLKSHARTRSRVCRCVPASVSDCVACRNVVRKRFRRRCPSRCENDGKSRNLLANKSVTDIGNGGGFPINARDNPTYPDSCQTSSVRSGLPVGSHAVSNVQREIANSRRAVNFVASIVIVIDSSTRRFPIATIAKVHRSEVHVPGNGYSARGCKSRVNREIVFHARARALSRLFFTERANR